MTYRYLLPRDSSQRIRPISLLLTLWISVWLQHNINLKGWNSQAHRDFPGILPKSLTQAMLVGTMLVGGSDVQPKGPCFRTLAVDKRPTFSAKTAVPAECHAGCCTKVLFRVRMMFRVIVRSRFLRAPFVFKDFIPLRKRVRARKHRSWHGKRPHWIVM